MAEGISEPIPARKPAAGLAERLRANPVIVKELRGRMRGFRAFAVLTFYLTLLGGLVGLVYLVVTASSSTAGNSVQARQALGKGIFGIVVGMELLAVSFIGPGLTASAISSEREHQTYDLLRTTLLPARAIVLGKFFSALLYVLLLIFAALPLQSLAFLFGGVSVEEVLIGNLMLVVTAITFCAVGLLISSLLARTLVSTVLAYAFAILWVFGLPFLIVLFSGLLGAAFSNMNAFDSPTAQTMLILGGWALLCLNPLGSAVASEAILIGNGSLWSFTFPIQQGPTLTLISPWIVYLIASLLISLLLLWLSVRFVRRTEK